MSRAEKSNGDKGALSLPDVDDRYLRGKLIGIREALTMGTFTPEEIEGYLRDLHKLFRECAAKGKDRAVCRIFKIFLALAKARLEARRLGYYGLPRPLGLPVPESVRLAPRHSGDCSPG